MSEAPTFPVELIVAPGAVFPAVQRRGSSDLLRGPWMPGTCQPEREGEYLRYFVDFRANAWSWWDNNSWCVDGTFPSDYQDVPWRGFVRPMHWMRVLELIAEQRSEVSPLGHGRAGPIGRQLDFTTAQTTRLLKRMASAGDVEVDPRYSTANCLAWRLRGVEPNRTNP